jgi:uncharacterized membrane protein
MTDEVAELAPRLRHFQVEIAATPETVYDCWSRFEEFPRFSPTVLQVQEIDPSHVLWEAVDTLGRRRVWESRILERVPGHRLAWRNASGSNNAGWVELSPLPRSRTRLELCLNYQPDGFLERVADVFGWIDAAIRRELRRFGRFVEGSPDRRPW